MCFLLVWRQNLCVKTCVLSRTTHFIKFEEKKRKKKKLSGNGYQGHVNSLLVVIYCFTAIFRAKFQKNKTISICQECLVSKLFFPLEVYSMSPHLWILLVNFISLAGLHKILVLHVSILICCIKTNLVMVSQGSHFGLWTFLSVCLYGIIFWLHVVTHCISALVLREWSSGSVCLYSSASLSSENSWDISRLRNSGSVSRMWLVSCYGYERVTIQLNARICFYIHIGLIG